MPTDIEATAQELAYARARRAAANESSPEWDAATQWVEELEAKLASLGRSPEYPHRPAHRRLPKVAVAGG